MGNQLRGYTQEQVDKVDGLTKQGLSQKAIEKATGVPVRTQRDWKRRGLIGREEWPEDQRWPGWTITALEEFMLSDYQRSAWEANLGLIQTAKEQGNHYIGWFFRRLVELDRRLRLPVGTRDWALAIAGLPVVGRWLDCPACENLAALIEKHHPWEGGLIAKQKRRAAYSQEARPLVAAVRQCVIEAQAQLVLRDLAESRTKPGPVLLAALADRVPLFDRVKRASPYRKYNLGGILLGILALPKGR